MTATGWDPRLKALQDKLAAEGALASSDDARKQLEAQLKEAKSSLKQLNELTGQKIEQKIDEIKDEHDKLAKPVKTLIEELERKLRECKSSKTTSGRQNAGLGIFRGLHQ